MKLFFFRISKNTNDKQIKMNEPFVEVEISWCCFASMILAFVACVVGLYVGLPVILNIVGFGALGPTARTLATFWQSKQKLTMLFAILQSVAMKGIGAAVTITVIVSVEATVLSFCKQADGLGHCDAVQGFAEKIYPYLRCAGNGDVPDDNVAFRNIMGVLCNNTSFNASEYTGKW
jgi:hypothetical protein